MQIKLIYQREIVHIRKNVLISISLRILIDKKNCFQNQNFLLYN